MDGDEGYDDQTAAHRRMYHHGLVRLAGSVPLAKADPLVSQGIGAANCAQLAGDIKPGDGLNNRFNLALFAWVQGYVSAANIALLEESGKLIDLTGFDDATVLRLVQEFCKANPDKKPSARSTRSFARRSR